jgi:hypothetical protein
MRKTIAIVLVCALGLLLGPAIIYDLVTDYRYAAQEYVNSRKPAHAKIHEAGRKINKGTDSVARLKVAVRRMEREKERIQRLLDQAPLPLAEMRRQHEALKGLVAKATETGGRIEYGGKVLTPAQMENVLARQRAELQKYERYAATIKNLTKVKARTEAAISQALDERGTVKADLEYAKSLTRVVEATSATRPPFEATVGEFREAEDVLAEVTTLQEVRLEVDERKSAFAGAGKLVQGK